MPDLLSRAIQIACEAHKNQTDKAGQPYILHPLHVMLQMQTPEERIVAVLHDVLEDSALTPEDLREEGFSSDVITALSLLSHAREISYEVYIARVATNPLATAVKLKDLEHNSDRTRILEPTSKDQERWDKYQRATQFLSEVR